EAAILLAPALSPDYDLTRALEAVRREMVVFWSPFDVFVLGLGTRVFGTIDRVRSVSAGLVGFRGEWPKLRQVRWRPSMASSGYLGGHVGPDSPAFLRRYVVPLLTAEPTRTPSPPDATVRADCWGAGPHARTPAHAPRIGRAACPRTGTVSPHRVAVSAWFHRRPRPPSPYSQDRAATATRRRTSPIW